MSKVWVSGTLAYDRIMNFGGRFADFIDIKKIHVLNLSFAVSDLKVSYGGTAGNIAYNLSQLQVPVGIVSALGKDFSDYYRRLRKLNIDCSEVRQVKDEFTSGAYIITDNDDNQITGFHGGAMNAPTAFPKCRKDDLAIIAAAKPENMLKLARYYRRLSVPYIFDPGQQITAMSPSQLNIGIKGADFIIGNDYEAALLQKRSRHKIRPNQVVITTFGKKGSRINSRGKSIRIPAIKVKRVLDPTGAGDAYRAGFAKGLLAGYDLKKCGLLASVVAGLAVQERGTQNHKLSESILAKHLKSNFHIKL